MVSCASVVQGCICMWYGMQGALHMFGHPHMFGHLPYVQHPHTSACSPVCLYVPGVSSCDMGIHPYVGAQGGISTSVRLLVSVSTSIGCPLCFILSLSCSSLCLKSLLPWLWLLLLWWLWCLLVCHLFHQWPWLPPWWGFLQHWVSMMWFCHHPTTCLHYMSAVRFSLYCFFIKFTCSFSFYLLDCVIRRQGESFIW